MLTRETVIRIVGPIDDNLILQIIDTGATEEELAEAYAWLASDEESAEFALGREPHGRVAQLCDILSSSETAEEDR